MTVRLERIDQPDGEVALVLIVPADRADAWETVLGAMTGLTDGFVLPEEKTPLVQQETPGKLLRRLRTERKLTQKAAAVVGGVNQARISDFESGVRTMPHEVAERFAQYFGVPVEKFVP